MDLLIVSIESPLDSVSSRESMLDSPFAANSLDSPILLGATYILSFVARCSVIMPSTMAIDEAIRIESFAKTICDSLSNASQATKIDIVNPIPDSTPTAIMCL